MWFTTTELATEFSLCSYLLINKPHLISLFFVFTEPTQSSQLKSQLYYTGMKRVKHKTYACLFFRCSSCCYTKKPAEVKSPDDCENTKVMRMPSSLKEYSLLDVITYFSILWIYFMSYIFSWFWSEPLYIKLILKIYSCVPCLRAGPHWDWNQPTLLNITSGARGIRKQSRAGCSDYPSYRQ